jgi:hypothetical protein
MTDRIPMDKFYRDHWSLLSYLETCCVDNIGQINFDRIRVNPATHAIVAGGRMAGYRWTPDWGTSLAGITLPQHDDIDCMEDLEAAGLIHIHSLVNGIVQMTLDGIDIAQQLRKWKANKKQYRDFKPQAIIRQKG